MQLEAYDCPPTLLAVWAALLHAAALDALPLPAAPTLGRRARRFLDRATQVPLARDDADIGAGIGTGLAGRSPHARVEAFLWHGRAVHAVAVNLRHELVAAA